ncbi:hypothetical protein DM02DRAFT_663208 [Periconia macrospinosa]|uniref:Uncharacterized protein n=1 Tax=Periconia macrospinosa TaxID=97972 RepID=A0A2V1D3H1_9PLEO|nr:hypothetical protein DM02DRAFT_663208 [Periconia macrospinosa]
MTSVTFGSRCFNKPILSSALLELISSLCPDQIADNTPVDGLTTLELGDLLCCSGVARYARQTTSSTLNAPFLVRRQQLSNFAMAAGRFTRWLSVDWGEAQVGPRVQDGDDLFLIGGMSYPLIGRLEPSPELGEPKKRRRQMATRMMKREILGSAMVRDIDSKEGRLEQATLPHWFEALSKGLFRFS